MASKQHTKQFLLTLQYIIWWPETNGLDLRDGITAINASAGVRTDYFHSTLLTVANVQQSPQYILLSGDLE